LDLVRHKVLEFARTLGRDNEVVLEATGNTMAIVRLVARRAGIVKGMTRTKNRIHTVLHANLILPYQGKLFMAPGRKWLEEQPLAEDKRVAVVSPHSTAWNRSWQRPNWRSPPLASETIASGGS
jgi:transposase